MNILYATDGSQCATTAGHLLASLPLSGETLVTVLCAAPDSGWIATPPVGAEGSIYPLMEEVAAEEQAAALRTSEAGAALFKECRVRVTTAVRRQSPAEAILDQAREDRSSLIVVGSHGMVFVEHLLLGSVSERVARYAPCSVLVARGEAIRQAVIAVDGTEASEHALEALLQLPLPTSLKITVVHVLRPLDMVPPLQLGTGLNWETVRQQYDEQLQGVGLRIVRHAQHRLKAAGHEAEIDVRCGGAADEVIALAREIGADLIVTGAANKSALGRLFLGSVSGRLLSHAPCSVLVARTPAVTAEERHPVIGQSQLAPQPVGAL
jgi:nucleotide-binding universal stress UspA family protein